uniref:hypothetical protein n=1 Tax=Nonomuraea pusilla TaxID=46177 RepID=UPI0006E1F861|nr:hypothetical protein [Nonomuraea pusilla]
MMLLGVVLVLLAAGAAALVATEESSTYTLFGYTVVLDDLGMFLAGAATGAALLLGLWLLAAGSRRTARHRREVRAARTRASEKVARLEGEKRELERRLEREQVTGDRLVAGGDTAPDHDTITRTR